MAVGRGSSGRPAAVRGLALAIRFGIPANLVVKPGDEFLDHRAFSRTRSNYCEIGSPRKLCLVAQRRDQQTVAQVADVVRVRPIATPLPSIAACTT
jgi:hypothetical protein